MKKKTPTKLSLNSYCFLLAGDGVRYMNPRIRDATANPWKPTRARIYGQEKKFKLWNDEFVTRCDLTYRQLRSSCITFPH